MGASPFEILGIARTADWATIRAAYRTLARRYHPDGSAPDPGRMAEVNRAYEVLERDRRAALERGAEPVPVGPGVAATGRGSLLERIQANARPTPILDFGEYQGWRIGDVARVNPQYLRWLSRHSSGIRYRNAIADVLGDLDVGRRAAFVR